jgi:hypothetical protein
MRASVIVVSYNSRNDLRACIDSILAELGPHDELIVVDNDSTDGSADLVRAEYPQATLICGPNSGYAGGNNRGAAAARGAYLVMVNPDTALQPGALDALIAPLTRDDDVALTTACVVLMEQPETINTCGNTMHYTGLTYCRGAGRPRSDYAAAAEVDAVSGAAFAIRRAAFAELGGFDELLFMYVEDTDLSWRARLAGYRCLYTPGAIVAHAYQPAYGPRKAFYLDRNRHIMLLKNLSAAMYLRSLPGLLLAELVTWGFLLLQGPRFWGVKPAVYRALWRERAAIRRGRSQAQALRRRHDRAIIGRMTYRLEFGQLANRWLAQIAAAIFHPAFWAARRLLSA